jgi:hypothetical protein
MEINKEMFDKKLIELYLKNDYNKDDFNYRAEDFKIQGEKQKSYPLYFSKKKWNMFLKNLKEDKEAYKSYVLGGGSETIEKYIKRGKTYNPPKMAAVASSSRFIYSTFKDKKYKDKISKIVGDILDGEFRFEHILPFKNVSKSFLDGSYISKDKAVFLEAKCHEIFDKHKIILRKSYYESGLLTSDNDFSLQISNVILKYFPDVSKNELTEIISRYKDIDSWFESTYISKENFEHVEEIMSNAGYLDKYVPFKDLVDNTYNN